MGVLGGLWGTMGDSGGVIEGLLGLRGGSWGVMGDYRGIWGVMRGRGM